MKKWNFFYGIAFAAFATCFVCMVCPGQNIRRYDTTSGLSENTIKCIVQDKEGYIWFATQDGLNMFNGDVFKSYGCSYRQTEGIGTLNILSILQHRDEERIWVTTQSASVFLFDPRTETFKELKLAQAGDPSPNFCHCITYDRDGNLWIGTDSGIFVYDEAGDDFVHYTSTNTGLPADLVVNIFCDSKGVIWVGSERGLSRFDPVMNDFINVRMPLVNGGDHIISIEEDAAGILWVGSWNNGFAKLDRTGNSLSYVRSRNEIRYSNKMRVRKIVADAPDVLWLCTNIGFFKYDISDNSLKQVVLSVRHPTDNVYSCLKDKEGGLWIGTYFDGVYYISPRAKQIECYTLDNVAEHLHGSAISSFCEDREGKIWVASENGGLSLFDPASKEFVETAYHIADDNLHALCMDGNDLYVGAFVKGLRKIDLETGHVEGYRKDRPNSIDMNNVYSLFKSRDRILYVGTDRGCYCYDIRNGGSFEALKELQGVFIYDIAEDAYGNIWFACYYHGLFRYNPKDRTWVHYRHDESDMNSLPHDKLLKIYVDDRQRLWICSEGGGVCRYDYETDTFRPLELSREGRPVYLTIVYGILNDAGGNLWLSSNHGIYCCDDEGRIIRHLTYEDGLQSNQYNFGATFRSSTGKLYFGGINGFNVLSPEELRENGFNPTVTASIRYGNDMDALSSASGNRVDTGTVVIPRNIDAFAIDFECLSYVAPNKNGFAYKIDKSDHWTHTQESSVTFMNFPYGKHVIRVRARNGDGYWSENEAVLHIDNQPPLLKSRAAKIGYVGFILVVLGLTVAAIERRRIEKVNREIQRIKTRQEQEAYTAKIEFFTHVAHEIKTPVSLIKAPLEVVMKNPAGDESRRNLEIIEKNAQRLLNLVNQLLDFKKINSEGYMLKMRSTDPVQLIRSVVNRFNGTILADIRIETELPEGPVFCLLDDEAYVKIVSNLLTNAVKHTRTVIVVSLDIRLGPDCRQLHLSVRDDGEGIPVSERAHVFDSFYQIHKHDNPRISGVGLGLSLVKLLAEKHDGCVYVDQDYTAGCSMCVDIPYREVQPQPETAPSLPTVEAEAENIVFESADQKILVVEDVEDMREFISGIVADNRLVLKAANGREALSILQKQDVDIIISDISMPEMNGFELLKEIRKDDMLCHIPFIMLTVESSLETKIKGLEYGADAYIEKPFSVDHLQATVQNLISRRELLRKRFLQEPLMRESEAVVSSRDRQWLDRVVASIQDNLNKTNISVDSLAAEMNLSRSSFQRKIKGLTGLTPVEFIRLIRLKKAAELLAEGDYRVNEVCYMVGFNKPSYFSSQFKKQFGILPKDFVQKN